MVSWFEMVGERAHPQKVGQVRINTFYETRKKPVWLVLLKVCGLVAMFAVGYALLLPLVPLPMWKSVVVASGVILIYTGLAFFVRPEPDTDNMGLVGGLYNDPTQTSDNMNRTLWQAHCLLGPGRFLAETMLDLVTLCGLTAEVTEEQHQQEVQTREEARFQAELDRMRERILGSRGNRTDERLSGEQELASARLLDAEEPVASIDER